MDWIVWLVVIIVVVAVVWRLLNRNKSRPGADSSSAAGTSTGTAAGTSSGTPRRFDAGVWRGERFGGQFDGGGQSGWPGSGRGRGSDGGCRRCRDGRARGSACA